MFQFENSELRKLVSMLSNVETINSINTLVANKVSGKISICYPNKTEQKNKIHFLLETDKKITLFDIGELTTDIKSILGYDYTDESESVTLQLKSMFTVEKINKLFNDVTLFSEENIDNIKGFFKKNYPHLYDNIAEENSNKQKNKFTIFSGKDDLAVHTPENIDPNLNQKLITHLKANPELWNALISSSELWDNLQLQVKEELIKCSPRHKPQTPGSSIPV